MRAGPTPARVKHAAVKIYFDGGCRPNPGPVETGVVVGGRLYLRDDHGQGDSHDAEWLALLEAVALARDLGLCDVVLLGDSASVVAQASGRAPRVPARFDAYRARLADLAAGLDRLRIRHVGRKQNLAGIALERAREWALERRHGKL